VLNTNNFNNVGSECVVVITVRVQMVQPVVKDHLFNTHVGVGIKGRVYGFTNPNETLAMVQSRCSY
jgi:hypothetical protein